MIKKIFLIFVLLATQAHAMIIQKPKLNSAHNHKTWDVLLNTYVKAPAITLKQLVSNQESEQSTDYITLICADGSCNISHELITKCNTIKHCIEDSKPDKSSSLDLTQFNTVQITKQVVNTLLDCIKDPSNCIKLTAQEIIPVFNAADALEAPKVVRNNLAQQYLNNVNSI